MMADMDWITDRIAIGNSCDARAPKGVDATINVAVDLHISEDFEWRHKVGLIDGPGNHPQTFMAAVLLLDALMEEGKKVLVHCHAGRSRSVMVISTWLAWREGRSFDVTLKAIQKLRQWERSEPALYALARRTLETLRAIQVW
jgi:hypothetical protein